MLFILLVTFKVVLCMVALLGAAPMLASIWQYSLIPFHRAHANLDEARNVYPRTAIVVPAWNEGLVIGETVDRLMQLEYPPESLRVYVVDDASTDETPVVLKAKEKQYPGRVFHLRRDKGGEGKAHTLNFGIKTILADTWCEALMIIDADVLFEPDSLRKMARHLANPDVGAVTAYIKEGSVPGVSLNKFIAFEYITAQAAARRSQNVMGVMACLAGGAQLHSRANLIAIGGQIDTSSLAEDTVTTFKTQLEGRRAFFEGNATVWAEEPGDIGGLWKQRLRWARGNLQVTKKFRAIWFRGGSALGSVRFGLLWFNLLLMPALMIASAVSLVTLYFLDFQLSVAVFHWLWIVNALAYLFVTGMSLAIDTYTAKRAWLQGMLYPGLVSFFIILGTLYPPLFDTIGPAVLRVVHIPLTEGLSRSFILFVYAWLALCMPVAYIAKVIEPKKWGRPLSLPLLYIAGYGPLLCTIGLVSYWMEWKGKEMKWDKTIKTGKVALPK